MRLFADDTCLFIEVDNREETAQKIQSDLVNVNNWSNKWLVTFSPQKTKSLIISNKNDRLDNPQIVFNQNVISEVNHHTYLGLKFSFNLKWNAHINDICTKASKRLNMMKLFKFKLDRKSLEIMYTTFVRPVMEYGIVVWGGTFDSNILKLEQINVEALRIITGATSRSNISHLYEETSLPSFMDRRDRSMLMMLYKVKINIAPNYLINLLPNENRENIHYNLQNNNHIRIPFARHEAYKRSFFPYALKLWNTLSAEIQMLATVSEFKKHAICNNEANILYYYGHRWGNIHHARLRIGCSQVNYDLFMNLILLNVNVALHLKQGCIF